LSALRVSIRSAISSIVYIRYRLGAAHVHCAQPVGHGTASFIFLFEIGPDLGPIIAGKNAAHEIGPDLGPIIAGKNAAQSSPSLPHPSTPPGSCCPARYAVGDGCNPSATLRSCSWHLRSILPVANVCFRHPMICYGISRALRFADLADRRS
jgi:hypothetical protein